MNRRSYDLMKGKPREATCQWSSQSYSLQGITNSFSLPMVIKSDVSSCSLDGQDFRLKLSDQPILLYSTRTKTKMVAKHLQYGRREDIFEKRKPGGEKLIIPEDYPGWFVYLKSAAGGVKCFESISDVCTARVKAFVTGSKLTGLQVTNHIEGRVEYKQRNFLPGTVFRADRIYVGKIRVQVGMKFFLFRKMKLQDVKYLKCYDVHNREILISVDKAGKFFEISPVFVEESEEDKYVFNTEELFALRQVLSPIMLIYGQFPRVDNFSGILHIQRKFVDETVVAATGIGRDQQVVLEIAVSSASTFHLALNSKDVIRHGEMGAALKHCKRKGEQFVQRIRVPFAMSLNDPTEPDLASNEPVFEQGVIETEAHNTLRKLDSITETFEDENIDKVTAGVSQSDNENVNVIVSKSDKTNKEVNGENGADDEPLKDITNTTTTKDLQLMSQNGNNDNAYLGLSHGDENGNDTEALGISEDHQSGCTNDDDNISDTAMLLQSDNDNANVKQNCENTFENEVCLKDETVDSIEAANDSYEESYTVIEEEKLINLNTMAEVILSTTTTTTTTKAPSVESIVTSGETSANSDEGDSDRDKMSEAGDSDDSGISEKNKSIDTTRL